MAAMQDTSNLVVEMPTDLKHRFKVYAATRKTSMTKCVVKDVERRLSEEEADA